MLGRVATVVACVACNHDTPEASSETPGTGGEPVVVRVHYRDFAQDCWCEMNEEHPGDWWRRYSVKQASEDCNDQFFWTASTAEGRCITTMKYCGDDPFDDPWLGPCDLVSGCCELVDEGPGGASLCSHMFGHACTQDGYAVP